MIAGAHGGGDYQNHVRGHPGRFLAGKDGGGELLIPEHIHDAVIADPVPAAEFLVGVVIGHAPAEAARHPGLGSGVVEDRRIP